MQRHADRVLDCCKASPTDEPEQSPSRLVDVFYVTTFESTQIAVSILDMPLDLFSGAASSDSASPDSESIDSVRGVVFFSAAGLGFVRDGFSVSFAPADDLRDCGPLLWSEVAAVQWPCLLRGLLCRRGLRLCRQKSHHVLQPAERPQDARHTSLQRLWGWRPCFLTCNPGRGCWCTSSRPCRAILFVCVLRQLLGSWRRSRLRACAALTTSTRTADSGMR